MRTRVSDARGRGSACLRVLAAAAVAVWLTAVPAVAAASQHGTPAAAQPATPGPAHDTAPAVPVPSAEPTDHAAPAPAQPAATDHAAPGAGTDQAAGAEHAAGGDHGESGDHGNPILEMAAKLFNFAILAGTLVYFLRSPFNEYLASRREQIRSNLVKAADMKAAAAVQLAAVDQQLVALPAELETLRRTGAAEVAAEEARIRELADRERERLLTQARREIGLQTRAAERDLVRIAAHQAVASATSEIERTITPDDHARLQQRYVDTVAREAGV